MATSPGVRIRWVKMTLRIRVLPSQPARRPRKVSRMMARLVLGSTSSIDEEPTPRVGQFQDMPHEIGDRAGSPTGLAYEPPPNRRTDPCYDEGRPVWPVVSQTASGAARSCPSGRRASHRPT